MVEDLGFLQVERRHQQGSLEGAAVQGEVGRGERCSQNSQCVEHSQAPLPELLRASLLPEG